MNHYYCIFENSIFSATKQSRSYANECLDYVIF